MNQANNHSRRKPAIVVSVLTVLCAIFTLALFSRADEPYARSRDYDLQHSRIVFHFNIDEKKIFGDVTHTLSILREGTEKLSFDSVGLTIESVKLNKANAKFETTATKLNIPLAKPAHAGEKYEVEIRYSGKPTKGLYFILPDKDYSNRPKQIWTQGESEDTRYYLPTYDYPNDRLTTEMVVTVPAGWITVSNGKLMGVTDAPHGEKTWTWRETLPSSTYLITLVAGEFAEAKDAWRNVPVTYYAPKDRGDRLTINYGRTPQMIDLFSKKLGVDYPWEKYAQAMVDEFVAGGMENSSATTNTAESLRNPQLVPEFPENEDPLISHELGHQWFGDLVTTKDWGNIWLNEGFATFLEYVWTESHFGKDQADYDRWRASRGWFAIKSLYPRPIVRHDFDDSSEFDGNVYDKGGLVLQMLRHQLGESAFYAGLKHYLEVNRGKNAVTADLIKAIEEETHTNVDQFFDQWIFGAGAPKFEISYTWDKDKKQLALLVNQVQKREGHVGLFTVPADVEITNASGPKLYPITISKESEVFTFPSDSAPQLVLFDPGNHLLKSVDFKKEKAEWFYQLKNATELSDRADAAMALAKLKTDEEATNALGESLRNDKLWQVREVAADALGEQGTAAASKQLLAGLDAAKEPWLRARIVTALGNFKSDASVAAKLDSIAKQDASFRARASALQSLGKAKTPNAYDTLTAAVKSDSPDGILRNAALRSLGTLGDDRAVPILRTWAAPGHDEDARQAAIGSLGRLEKGNKEITQQLAGYLSEPHYRVRVAAIFALGARGDATAIPALESLLKSNDLTIELAPMIKDQIEHLKNPSAHGDWTMDVEGESEPAAQSATGKPGDDQRMLRLEELIKEMNDRLKAIEQKLPQPKP